MSTQGSGGGRGGKRGNWGVWIVLAGVGLLVGGVVILGSSLIFGTVSGEEFSPDTFDRRTFAYCEIPVVRWQITPIRRASAGKGVENFLAANKLIPDSTAETPRWDLVRMTNVKEESEKCDARILCRYFDAVDEKGTAYWLDWTQKQPQLAKIFWPAVCKAARQQLYIFVPDLVECARHATDPTQFQADLDRVLSRKFREFAELQQQLERHEDAVTLYTEALALDAGSDAALRGRSRSLQALGKNDEAAADLTAAAKLSTKS